ncbi:complex I subunit 5 family protein [Eisenbergiella tayi]|uniref:Hydrogenase-4 component B n=1 Tax=Eisenbergiella tayi TaxID=1432052 RepID=A0A1E3A846_9FIRM|nr:proton-conducting transporter membrane subunit [Eisenbergiella tayi]ODM04942.1 Hydrogenase-4 component B [Eisenbergiella tayi]
MKESGMLLFPIFFPIIMGILLLLLKNSIKRAAMITLTAIGLFGTAIAVIGVIGSGETAFTLFQLTMRLPVYFKVDAVGRLFVSVVTIVWVLAGIYAFRYMQHEDCNKRYFGFYLIVYGVLVGLDFSGNLITFYLFYECMTLLSLPLVFHTRTREAVMAGLKYLFYSLAGAYLALFGLYFINRYGNTLTFTAGGVLDFSLVEGHEGLLLVVAFLMLMGFGVKAGLFPMQGWLPAAHPVAPAPASAVLSGIIVKSGVLGIIRVVYFIFGAEFLKGSWVQKVFLGLALGTVFLGSMLAYLEKGLKKRLAYSTVSQVSYILFGLLLLNPAGMIGAFLHVIFHAVIKSGLFLCAGAIIFRTGKTRVDELRGIGKEMPVTIGCMTLLSLALIGIPPASGFVSKWYLAVGSLSSETGFYSWLGPVVLLLSALLTAGYLLPITMKGFFPGEEESRKGFVRKEADSVMLVPILLLAVLAVVLGMFPGGLISLISNIAQQLFQM